ncbi:molybdenum ABC transporter ATP-binding protein [Mesorhizobium sp. YIM 152430]|uniref:molybdenum ABC transporter ATP-binding protein n=1 Tax=Mesorhizobium sp. YIM 152430 TaxID=3031761 RepID=UPI0023DCB308|nr:molybdenum ABC transporter ATP-binding protein [Mesorhizobium sp. YIM 152430]MDF1600704.1 molybdenum ABC transporter ATP-binding protein [Mesorhizobium sp. YIM 152430]
MSLDVALRHQMGDFALDIAFRSAGRLTALFGPSGSGKTSIVNMIGGLMRPREGRIATDGRVLVDTQNGTFLRPHKRRIGYVFQDARLFPHLTVRQNLVYGRRFVPRAQRYGDFSETVELLGIGHLLERKPAKLSGGERQRVAIGRALIASPRLILMDEPLASLDDARKAEILPFIERLRDEARVPVVYVSHSVAEVARLASDIVVLDRGRVSAAGPAREILAGLDLLPGAEGDEGGSRLRLEFDRLDARSGLSLFRSAAGIWHLPPSAHRPGDQVSIFVRASDILLATQPPEGISTLNVFPGRIVALRPARPHDLLVDLDCNGDLLTARITRHSGARMALASGASVHAIVKTVRLKES